MTSLNTEGSFHFDPTFYNNNLYPQPTKDFLKSNEIVLIDAGQAGFTAANENCPIIATQILPLFVVMGGYDSTNRISFIAHFILPKEVEVFKDFFIRSYTLLAKQAPREPLEIHLRGGVLGEVAEDIVSAVQSWIDKSKIPMKIASRDVLSEMSRDWNLNTGLAIDSRTGCISNFKEKMALKIKKLQRFPPIFLNTMAYNEDFLPPLVDIPLPIDYSIKFKDFPVAFEEIVPFTRETKDQTIEKIASFVSKIYATFPDLEDRGRDELRKKGIYSSLTTSELATCSECKIFEDALKNKIIKELSRRDKIELSTDLCPYGMLADVFKDVFGQIINPTYLIPHGTLTTVKRESHAYLLDMHLGVPRNTSAEEEY